MNKRATNWSAPIDAATAYKRAGGRRRYNAQRQLAALIRRMRVSEMLLGETAAVVVPEVKAGHLTSIRRALVAIRNRGMQARIARELGVSPSTICRDLALLNREWQARASAGNRVGSAAAVPADCGDAGVDGQLPIEEGPAAGESVRLDDEDRPRFEEA